MALATSVYVLPDECKGLDPAATKLCVERVNEAAEKRLESEEKERREKQTLLENFMDRMFTCHADEDCVAIKNGCGLKSIFGSSSNAHNRFKCICVLDQSSSECVPEGKIVKKPISN